ncbi:hypothetical protein KP509_28G021200 [Ceratopteris richardii]|uniref:Uncharacterized protein n=1 Tax=Ceratopteris richardii TaxID=49495 RepID=A0A8T2RCS6_CERRI|nr:hypothetical protein KP509_28G021200 [Ceratopteris richardii]
MSFRASEAGFISDLSLFSKTTVKQVLIFPFIHLRQYQQKLVHRFQATSPLLSDSILMIHPSFISIRFLRSLYGLHLYSILHFTMSKTKSTIFVVFLPVCLPFKHLHVGNGIFQIPVSAQLVEVSSSTPLGHHSQLFKT